MEGVPCILDKQPNDVHHIFLTTLENSFILLMYIKKLSHRILSFHSIVLP